MSRYQNLSDAALTHGFDTSFSREDAATADVLEYIAEFSERKLYLPAGYPSLLDYCVQKLGRTRDSVRRQIHAAHTAQRFPLVFDYVRDGKLTLSAVTQLAPYLSEENVTELLGAASHGSKEEIADLIRRRFHSVSAPTLINSVDSAPTVISEPNGSDVTESASSLEIPCVPERTHIPEPPRSPRPVQMDDEMEHLVGRAQELLGYELRSDDPKEVLRRALRVLVGQLEKRKARKPRMSGASHPQMSAGNAGARSRPSSIENERRIPNAIKSAVWQRDRGRCTFVGENGHACESRRHLEFDHVMPVARGGESTVANLRLRCRAHNQLEAERAFGAEFMRGRGGASRMSAARKARGREAGA